ncbi:carboxy terminal-processing peptidase [Planctomyces sp. SH-PL14]|uniref:carboxy terminal-processing peptidase n=1 Tax=Planctomyces sp. SH-PL14 TaxID=1632864 RepID=UPI00078E2C6A|nr:carboxy terminal-processing peptidase [Planctomyces sp. SH-PL14]AMV17556.1 Tail-specific protease precursor [Planctomyces sp. SH-PL14]
MISASRRVRYALALSLAAVLGGQLVRPALGDADDKDTTKLVVQMVSRFHLSRPQVDDAVSSKFLDLYIKHLDLQKLYFLKADIDEFNKHRTTLDDELKAGDVGFGVLVFNRYKERMQAQVALAHKWIDANHDFSVEETMVTDRDQVSWAKDQAELDDRWRQRIKFDLLQAKLDGTEMEKAKERLHKRYRNALLNINNMSQNEAVEFYLTSFTQVFDPHSTYMSPQSWENFQIDLRLSLDGIGAALRSDDGFTIVAEIVKGGAADRDGRLKVGDKILAVGQGDKGDLEDIYEAKLNDVVRKIRGERGTIVRLQVKPEAGGDAKTYNITRAKVELQERAVKGEIIDTLPRTGRPGRIGVISLPSFYRDFEGAQGGAENFKSAAKDMELVLQNFAREGVDAVIVDLRDNGGGALSEAIEVSGHFLDQGPVVQVKEPNGRVRALDDELQGVLYNGPLVVVCNRLSASASEIFAGVIKDYHRGIVVGDTTTHGKGTVQNLMEVAASEPFRIFRGVDRGKLKMTIQQFYRVNGHSTQSRGVRSDVVLPSILDHLDQGEAFLDNALPFDQIQEASHEDNRMVSPNLVAQLQKGSEGRVARDEEFGKVNKAITRYLERKSRKSVSLNETVQKAERDLDKEIIDQEGENTDEEGLPKKKDEKFFPENAYNKELLNVTLDYIAGLKNHVAVQK